MWRRLVPICALLLGACGGPAGGDGWTITVYYTAVFRPSTEGEIQVYGYTYQDYRAKYDQLWNQGWRLKFLLPYVVNGQVAYTAAFRPATNGEVQPIVCAPYG